MKSNYFKGILLLLLTTVTFFQASSQCIVNAYATNITADCGTDKQTYDVVVEFSNKPATGNLRLRNANTNSNIATTTVSSLGATTYTFTGVAYDMSFITEPFLYVDFSADSSCRKYLHIPLYSCTTYPTTSTAGTYVATVNNGKKYVTAGSDEYVLNYNGNLTLRHNRDYQVSFKESSKVGVEYFFYPCKPEVTVHPYNSKCTLVDSSDLFATYNSTDAAYPNPDMKETSLGNNSPLLTAFTNTFSQNKAWVMPTAHDEVNFAYRIPSNYFANAAPFSIQYLNQITSTKAENCAGGSINFTSLFGGYPEFHASNYTITNNASGSLSTTSVALNGSFSLTGLTNGTAYNVTITDVNGGETILSGTFCSAAATADCGSCATSCPIGFDNNISDLLGFSTCNNIGTTTTNETITNTHTVRSSASGTLGFVQQVAFLDGCKNSPAADATLAARTYALYAIGNCNGTAIVATTPNGGNSSTLNPEWTGLTPNTDYILKITVPITTCGVNATCADYYHPAVSTNCSTCATATCPILHATGTIKSDARTNATTAMTNATAVSEINTNITTGTSKTICVPITVSSSSTTLGFKHAFNLLGTGFCTISDPDIQRSYVLKPANNCGGSAIAPKSTNAQPVSSGFNPEWDVVSTTPGAGQINAGEYVLCITISLSNPMSDCILLDKLLLVEYQVQPTCTNPTTPTITSVAATCAAAGTSTISNYSASNTYTFNPAGPTVAADGVISGMIAGTPYTVTAKVSTCTSTDSASFSNAAILTTPAAPTATVTEQPNCSTATGTITVTAPTNGTGITYTVTGTSPVVSAQTNSTGTFSGLAAGTYNVTTSTNGCTSTATALTVNQQPITPAAPTASVTAQPTCSTATGTITVTAPANGTGITYTVTGTSPVVAPQTNSTGTFSGLAAGTYNVTTSINGCTSTATSLTVNAQPITPAAPTASVTIQPTCITATGTITVTAPANGTGITYTVTGTSPVVAPQSNSTGTFSGLTAGTYNVTTSANGCTSTATVLTVNQQPITPATPTATVTVQPTCITTTGTITVTAPANGTGITYTVTGTSPVVAAQTNSTGTFSGLAAGTYNVTTSANGCTSTATVLTVNQQPITPAAPTASVTQPTCSTATGTITVTTPANANGITYTVTGTSPVVAAQTNSTGTFSGLAAGTYNVTTSANVCTSTVISLTVNQQPVTPIAPTVNTPINYCQDDVAVPLTASGSDLLWYTSMNGTGSITAPTPSTATIGSTTYYVSQILNTCESDKTAIVVNISNVTISLEAGCIDADYTLTATAPAGTTFKWYQGTTILSATGNTLVVTTPNIYRVVATLDGCTTEASENITNTYCEIPKGISPNGDGLNDTFDLSNLQVKKLEIFNRYGMEMYSKTNYKNEWGGYSDSGLNLPDGTYYYVIQFESGKTKTGWVYKNSER